MSSATPFGQSPLRYGEPDWNSPPVHIDTGLNSGISQQPRSNKSYEELRYDHLVATGFLQKTQNSNIHSTFPQQPAIISLRNKCKMINVEIGLDQWTIHEDLFAANSKFVQAMMMHGFKEQQEGRIRLPEEDPEIFDHYVRFLYTGRAETSELRILIRMYTLGTHLQDASFEKTCYNIIKAFNRTYTPGDIKYVLDMNSESDPLRELCIDQVGSGILTGQYTFADADARDLLADDMADLMRGVTRAVAKKGLGFGQGFAFQSQEPEQKEPSQLTSSAFWVPAPQPQVDTGSLPSNRPGPFGPPTSSTRGTLFGNNLPTAQTSGLTGRYNPNIDWHADPAAAQPQTTTSSPRINFAFPPAFDQRSATSSFSFPRTAGDPNSTSSTTSLALHAGNVPESASASSVSRQPTSLLAETKNPGQDISDTNANKATADNRAWDLFTGVYTPALSPRTTSGSEQVGSTTPPLKNTHLPPERVNDERATHGDHTGHVSQKTLDSPEVKGKGREDESFPSERNVSGDGGTKAVHFATTSSSAAGEGPSAARATLTQTSKRSAASSFGDEAALEAGRLPFSDTTTAVNLSTSLEHPPKINIVSPFAASTAMHFRKPSSSSAIPSSPFTFAKPKTGTAVATPIPVRHPDVPITAVSPPTSQAASSVRTRPPTASFGDPFLSVRKSSENDIPTTTSSPFGSTETWKNTSFESAAVTARNRPYSFQGFGSHQS